MAYPTAVIVGTLVVLVLRLASLRLGVTIPQPQWITREDDS